MKDRRRERGKETREPKDEIDKKGMVGNRSEFQEK